MIHKRFRKVAGCIILALLAQGLALGTGLAQVTGVTETKLPNGLVVLMKEVHAAPVFTAQVWFKVGSRNEHTGITGVSHLLEHMLFNSSKNYKKGEITRLVRERGGIDNAATWTDFTYYWEMLSSEHVEFALKTLAERMGKALLLEDEFAKERTVVLSEMQGRENDPGSLLFEAVNAAAFNVHPYHWPVIGWQSDVENVSRDQVASYYRTHYHPGNATLVLVGDIDGQKALPLVRKYFGSIPAGGPPRPPYSVEPPQRGERTVTVRREGNAERVMLAYRTPDMMHPDTYALTVLDQILSGGKSSRLYQALVEKQLAVSAWSSGGARKDPSLFYLGATARQGVTADQLEKALLEQVELAKSAPPSAEELQAAKNQLKAYFIFQNDSVSDQGEQLGYYNTLADWRYLNTLLPRIQAVTAEQVQEVARKYLVTDSLTIGRFIPTGSAAGGAATSDAPTGTVQRSMLPGRGLGVSYKTGAKPSAPPKETTATDHKLVRPHRAVLGNGIVVIVQENHSNPTIAISGSLEAGGCFDPPGKSGVTSLTAEMVGRGTHKRTALQLAREVEYVGGSLDVDAGTESVRFGCRSLAKDFELMLDLLSDQLRNPSFPQDQLEKAKGQTASALEQSKESPDARAFRAFYNAIFPEAHPYHELTVEQAQAELASITREDLVAFHAAHYRPETTIIVIAGDVDSKEAVAAVEKYFGDWSVAGDAQKIDIPTVPPPGKASKIVIPMTDKSEVSVVFGHPMGLRRSDPEYYAARIMNQVLGGSGALASILGNKIREKQGLVYDVYSTFDAERGAGPWYVSLGTSPKDVDKAVQMVQDEVKRYRSSGPTKAQFEEAREFIIGVFPIALETNAGVARALLSAEFFGLGMEYLTNYARIYRSVTLQQVKAAAAKYLRPDSATLVIAGPYDAPP